MKILWVKAGGLVPPDTGGKIRSYNILRQLAQDHTVTGFLFHAGRENRAHEQLNTILRRVVQVTLDLPSPKSFREAIEYLVSLLSSEPYNMTKYCKRVVRERLVALLQEENYDVILCDFLVAAGVIPWDFSCPKVIFAHNVEEAIWRRHYEIARNPLWKATSWYEWKRMAAAERKYLAKADLVIAVSENDRETFAQVLDQRKLTVVQTGADTDFFRPCEDAERPYSLVFTGAMDWLPNEDAIIYFIEEIFPLVRQRAAESTLLVVGRNPSKRLRELVSHQPNIQLTGWVEDVRPYLARSAVCIVPLRIGGGTRLKIFEAMSMARSVVSTSIGAEGLPVKNGENIFLADTPDAFADRVLYLLNNASCRAAMGQAARRLVEDNYDWAKVSKDFARALEWVVRRKSEPAPLD